MRHAPQLYLDKVAVRNIARILDLTVERDVVILQSGRHLPLPQDQAEIAFDIIAEKLGLPADQIILALTRSVRAEMDFGVTPFPLPARKTRAT